MGRVYLSAYLLARRTKYLLPTVRSIMGQLSAGIIVVSYGLAPHPQRSEFATLGDDGTVRVFDSELFKCIRQSNLKQGGRAIVYSPEGTKIAVGIGTPDEANDADGSFKILNESTLQVIYQGKDANGWITLIQWSPDGDTLCGFSRWVYLYTIMTIMQ